MIKTRLVHTRAKVIKWKVDFSNLVHVGLVGKNGGLILMWGDDWDVNVRSCSKGQIDSMVTWTIGFNGTLSNFVVARRLIIEKRLGNCLICHRFVGEIAIK